MSDFAAARRNMVDGQLRTNDVTDGRLLAAMLRIPREQFTPDAFTAVAYLDLDLPVGDEPGSATRRLLKPLTLAKLIHAAEIGDTDRVLDVGCATGYASAILSHIASSVVALEVDPSLAARARKNLTGYPNVTVVDGALVKGCPNEAPFDVILLNGATEIEPDGLCRQLAPAGRLVCVVGGGPGATAMIYRHAGDGIAGRRIFDASCPVLPGFGRRQAFAF